MATLIRHAESTYNKYGDKSKDVPITEDGKNQCIYLEGEYDLVVCSTLRRARETLDHSNIKYKNVIFTELCREFKNTTNGDYYSSEVIEKETEDDLKERITKFREYLRELNKKYEKIAVITHSIFLHRMTGHWFGNCNFMGFTP